MAAYEAGAAGVYGAAHDAADTDVHSSGLVYVAVGISPDGLGYGDKHATNVTKLSVAFALGSDIAIIGSALGEERFSAVTIDEKVALVDQMLQGTRTNSEAAVEYQS